MSLLAEVCATLDRRDVPHAVIGAAALAVHGVPRATHDLDLVAIGVACLVPSTWQGLRSEGHAMAIRPGDENDPLEDALAEPLAGALYGITQARRPVSAGAATSGCHVPRGAQEGHAPSRCVGRAP